MIPCTQEFKDALKKSHKMVTRCEVWQGDQFQRTLDISEGEITIDRRANHRRRASITLVDTEGDLTPGGLNELLMPYGTEFKLFRGIALPSGDELKACGVFGIKRCTVSDGGQTLTVQLEGMDRSRAMSRAKLTDTIATTHEADVQDVFMDILGLSGFQSTLHPSLPAILGNHAVAGLAFERSDDVWKALKSVIENIGGLLYFDVFGDLAVEFPSLVSATTPAWSFVEGTEAIFMGIQKSFDNEETINHVVVIGEPTCGCDPVTAEVFDLDPNSPTYYLGPYGDVTEIVTSTAIHDATGAAKLANKLFAEMSGRLEELHFPAVVNPALDTGDYIFVERAASKISGLYEIERMSMPMVALRAMDVGVKERRL